MSLRESLASLLSEDIPATFKRFGRVLDAQWVTDALTATGTASVRRRRFPAEIVVWLVIGMALFRDRSIRETVDHLGLVMPSATATAGTNPALAPSAITKGRYRTGAAAVEHIFRRTAETWTREAADSYRWRGLALYGIDGTTLNIPDTPENREEFCLPGSSRGQAGYPQVRMVALMALRSHLMGGLAFGPCRGKRTGETTLALQLWPMVPEQSLVMMDKGFINYGVFYRLRYGDDGQVIRGRHWLARAKKHLVFKTLKTFAPGDELVEVKLTPASRRADPGLPETMTARAIRYERKGFRPQTLLTSLVDADRYPADEIVALYHERWDIEMGYDEIKTHMLERQETLRSKKPEGIRQEIWGIGLAYNLVRKEMLAVAERFGVEPRRISFRHSLQLIRIFCVVEAWTSAPSKLHKRLDETREMVGLLLLPKRRSERRYERHVKVKMSGYKRNRGHPGAKPLSSRKKTPK